MTKLPDCKICMHPGRARLIEIDWADGMSAKAIAEDMTANGWPITGPTVLKHLKEHVPDSRLRQNQPVRSKKRDAAIFVRDRVLDEIERREQLERAAIEGGEEVPEFARINILDKDLQPALNTALKAEQVIAKREDNSTKRQIDLFSLMLGQGEGGPGALAPMHLIGDGIIEGEAREVPNDDPEA